MLFLLWSVLSVCASGSDHGVSSVSLSTTLLQPVQVWLSSTQCILLLLLPLCFFVRSWLWFCTCPPAPHSLYLHPSHSSLLHKHTHTPQSFAHPTLYHTHTTHNTHTHSRPYSSQATTLSSGRRVLHSQSPWQQQVRGWLGF